MLSAKQLLPGQSGQIEVLLKTEGITGKVGKSVTVTSNDPRQPQVVLNVTAVVEPEFTLSERSVYFGTVPRGKEITKDVVITIAAERPVKVLSAESTDPNVAVRLEPVPGTNSKSVKMVTVQKADAKEGYHFGILVIKTSSTLTPELKIPVRGMITAAQND